MFDRISQAFNRPWYQLSMVDRLLATAVIIVILAALVGAFCLACKIETLIRRWRAGR